MNELNNAESISATPNREHKSSVFSMLFSDPAILRELYSAIEGVDLPPDIPIDINTISNAFTLGKLNDLSFVIDNRLVVLAEHQSTICENMPFRMMEYIIELYKRSVDPKKILKRSLVKIPKPEFIVLYNGIEPYDEYKELKLSDAFMDTKGLKDEEKEGLSMEMIVKVYNINYGHNPKVLEKSQVLNHYSIFIDKIREYQKEGLTLAESLKSAVQYCKENKILEDFMEKHGREIINMLWEEYTVENAMEAKFEEGIEKGVEKGREEIARNALAEGFSIESIHKITGLDLNSIKNIKAEL